MRRSARRRRWDALSGFSLFRPFYERAIVKILFIVVLFLLQFCGFALASYGVLREAFATTAIETGAFSREAFDEKAFDVTGLTWWQKYLVTVGAKVGLLPEGKELSVQARKRNAGYAIAGVILIGLSIILDFVGKFFNP